MKNSLVLTLLFVLPLFSCSEKHEKADPGPKKITLSPEQVEIAEGINAFGFELFKEIADAEDSTDNIFISPLSVHMALSMAWNGAAGNTREEMMEVLNYPVYDDEKINNAIKKLIEELLSADEKVESEIANSIWYRHDFNVEEDFLDVNREFFNALVNAIDFEDPGTVDVINNWVAEATNNRIEEIIDNIEPEHVMFLINAIYFNGIWHKEFVEENTEERSFYLPGGEVKEVMTMETEGEFSCTIRDGYRVVELPYGHGNYCMLILLPDPELGIEGLTSKLDNEEWNEITGSLNGKKNINLRLPRFTFDFDVELGDVLIALGMEDAFNEQNADFTKINRGGGLYISRVRHNSFIEVNEEGTEAAAVTSVEVGVVSYDPDKPIAFHVNRPFLFAIRETTTNTLLFLGRLVEP